MQYINDLRSHINPLDSQMGS